jgi:primosomal protein N' (replication factor Y) (superfamily II helicase)
MSSPELDFDSSTLFAELIIPVPIAKLFTYRVPQALTDQIRVGQRVIVPFGKKKILTGIVFSLHPRPPQDYEAKLILELLDDAEVIYAQQFKLYQWVADYYMCTLGEVIIAALPAGLKLSSESMVQLDPRFNLEETPFDFSAKERLLLNRLQKDTLTYTDVSNLIASKNIYSILRSLQSKSAIILFEEVKEKYKPKTEKRIRISNDHLPKKKIEALFEKLSQQPKQEAIVLKYLQDIPVFSNPELNKNGIAKNTLLGSDLSASALSTLLKNKIVEEFEVVVPRFGFEEPALAHAILLSEPQVEARNKILSELETKNTVLLHGVTGSGKTEIYIDLIKRALDGGNQVLYLLPEIALTTQIVFRLKKIFGNEMGIYHSKFSDNERVEVWNGVLVGKVKLIIGVRSSIFLPYDNLGLIIVDEEHDSSYKQNDPSPRYQARDTALMMAHIHGAKVILGSATPSLESFHHAHTGRFGMIELKERFGEAQLPEILFADLAQERKRKTMKGEFSSMLLKGIEEALANQEQVILFQNRRGYSPMIECQDCGWVPKCINCAVSLTYHQYRHSMICHYCGYKEDMPGKCHSCSSTRIQTLGYGTEKLEEELTFHFPEAKIQRMDLDTTRSKSGYENIIQGFESGNTNILVGTQMVTKGLDFNNVSLVGVFDADRMMHFPDFRSYERAFQLIMQVSGRSGRRAKKGKVIIQTSSPQHPLFSYVKQHDVTSFISEQLTDRHEHQYPPFSRLLEITLKHLDKKVVHHAASSLSDQIKNKLNMVRIVGPGEPMVSKIRNEFLMTMLVKIGRDQGKLAEIKRTLTVLANQLIEQKEYRNIKIAFDVDPS